MVCLDRLVVVADGMGASHVATRHRRWRSLSSKPRSDKPRTHRETGGPPTGHCPAPAGNPSEPVSSMTEGGHRKGSFEHPNLPTS